jgi:hypothetical protein
LTPILICIDVEPLDRQIPLPASNDWRGVEETADLLEKFRREVHRWSGRSAHFSWFLRMDPQIETAYGSAEWGATRYSRLLARLRDAGDEVGLHIHAWRWDEAAARWVKDHGNSDWIEHCVDTGLSAFSANFGAPCRFFRFGDGYLDDRIVGLLAERGVAADLTLEPGYPARDGTGPGAEIGTGRFPDTRRAPRRRYRPSPRNFRKPGLLRRRCIWMIPVSTGTLPGHPPTVTFNLAFYSPSMRWLFDDFLARRCARHMTLVARTEIGAHEEFRVAAQTTLAYLENHPRRDGFCFVTPAELIGGNLDRQER